VRTSKGQSSAFSIVLREPPDIKSMGVVRQIAADTAGATVTNGGATVRREPITWHEKVGNSHDCYGFVMAF
jgi:hypothetical protein